MNSRDLQLTLQPAASLPCNLCWHVEEGYVRVASWNEVGELCTLGLWGPGDLVIPSLITVSPLQLLALSAVQVEAVSPTQRERERFLVQQCQQTSTLLRRIRTRPVELRLFQLLLWLGERFGRVSRRGVSLCFEDMNLTHRHLAEIAGMTRVTVTKSISHFRDQGYLIKEGSDELLVREALPSLQRSDRGPPRPNDHPD